MQWTLTALIDRFKATLIIDNPDVITITHLCTLESGSRGGITCFAHPKYFNILYQTSASAIFVSKDFQPTAAIEAALLGVDDPYACFCELIEEVHQAQIEVKTGIEFPSYIGEQVSVGKNIYRGAFSYIGNHVKIGSNVKVYPHVYIGDYVTIGDDTVLYSGAKVASYTIIGNRCVIHAGAIIGSNGFGFTMRSEGGYKRISSIGKVVLSDEVEIGANTTIDAATVATTLIGEGVKIDNLVQIAHNVHIGNHTAIAAQTGIAGSTHIGSYCRLGGQTGIAGHLQVGDHVIAMGRAGITRSFKQGHITLSGTPAFEHKKFLSCYARFKKLALSKEKHKK